MHFGRLPIRKPDARRSVARAGSLRRIFELSGGRLRGGDRHHAGFTLIELLVVIGIIAILIGLVLSVLARVRGAQKSVRCIANLKGIGDAFQVYVHDSKGRFPDPGRANLSWEQMLLKYYRGSFACDGDTELYPAVGSSYDWRDTGHNETSLAGRLLADVTRPDGVLAFEALPGWHARRKINVVRVDGSTATLDDDACFRDLLSPIGSAPAPNGGS
jgi:prepilin-type N-terminal cleavage/methylation domain-containing protein